MSSKSHKDKYLDIHSSSKKKSHKKDKKKHKKHKRKRKSSTSSDGSSEEEWVESTSTKEIENSEKITRDNWMTEPSSFSIPTFSKPEKQNKQKEEAEKRRLDSYNPSTSVRELNPHWKNGGSGLPKQDFKRPDKNEYDLTKYSSSAKASGSWRKKTNASTTSTITSPEVKKDSSNEVESVNLNDKEINNLAAKIIKAEIMGNKDLCEKLKAQLDAARNFRQQNVSKENPDDEKVLLISTDSKGTSRPLERKVEQHNPHANKKKKQKVQSHEHGERVRYFGDDDRFSLREMFEQEKYSTSNDSNEQFMKISSKMKNPNDDLEDVFMDKAQRVTSDEKIDEMNRNKAIQSHKILSQSIENCKLCIDSCSSLKNVIVSMGEYVYLSVPPYQSLTEGHCIIAPIKHVPCSTQLDENIWEEIEIFRKTITKMFTSNSLTTVFFEISTNLNRFPHMSIECVPLPLEEGSLAPMYFKKAILECEKEWAMNKKLVDLKGKNVRRAIPKGLSYFQVGFDSDPGFAHVIEDKHDFPNKFAQEIIGGLLDLDYNKWRRPSKENSEEQKKKVDNLKKIWNSFDCTK